MVTLCKNLPNSLDEPEPKTKQNKTKPSDAPSAPLLPTYPATSPIQHHPTGLYSLQLILEGTGLLGE
jgi:hypothetical protein